MESIKLTLFLHSLFSAKDSIISEFLSEASSIEGMKELLLKTHLEGETESSDLFPSVHFLNAETICIKKGVQIAPGALIEGPCYLGENVSIGHCALIRKGTFLAPKVHIGHCSEISRSVFLEGAKAPHFNYVGDSIIGQNVNLGAHATLANLRLDKKEIVLRFDGGNILTGNTKFGSLVGDNSSIGCGVILNPGTIVRKNSQIPPLSVQKGYI